MAYDPNDPADKKIMKDAIAAALEEAAEEHEADVQGLKDKNKELIKKLKAAQTGEGDGSSAADVERLEGELRQSAKDLKVATKARDTAVEERDTAVAERDAEKTATRNLLVDSGLTSELTGVNVAATLLPAVKALLKDRVEIKEVGGERKAFVDGKPLGEFVKTWSQSDEGKHFVTAPLNGGGGGGKPPATPSQGGEKKLSEMNLEERTALAKEDPQKFNALLNADKAERKAARREI